MSAETRFTPGPWQWEIAGSGHVRLATPDRGRLIVMDFARKGMQNAEPRFAVMSDDQPRGRRGGILRSVSELIADNVEGGGWLDHPDAALIAASPKLYEALAAMVNAASDEETAIPDRHLQAARAALKKARGEV